MDRRWGPLGLGVLAGLVQFALPEFLGVLVLIAAALAAGWMLPEQPMKAALLFLAPAVVLGAVRLLIDGDSSVIGPLIFGLILAVMFVAFFTHIGAGIALRRREKATRR